MRRKKTNYEKFLPLFVVLLALLIVWGVGVWIKADQNDVAITEAAIDFMKMLASLLGGYLVGKKND